jgi:NADH-quinone oxidoreductase subunit M
MELHFPWIELAVLVPLAGALWVGRVRNVLAAKRHARMFCGLTLALATGAWVDFASLDVFEAHDRWDVASRVLGADAMVLDSLSAPLLPLAALLYLLTVIATMRTKAKRLSFAWTLVSEAILMATLCCRHPWGVIALLALGTVPPLLELRRRGRSTRVFSLHMGLFVGLLVAGWGLVEPEASRAETSPWAVGLLTAAVLIRSGIVPLHCWMTDLFEKATFGTSLLFVTPMVGAYAAVRLLLPVAPDGALELAGWVSLFTAVYAAGMALVQTEARRFFCYLFLSHSSLVFVGLEIATPIGVTAALCVWLSVGLALAGFGLTLRSIEARTGRLSLATFHGLYDHTPRLATLFLLTGLASVGFPGTFGFVGTELLVDGAVQVSPAAGMAVVVAAALNGIAVVRAYFLLFTGTRHATSVPLASRWPERVAVLILALLILGGGVFPQPGIASRHEAAMHIVRARRLLALSPDAAPSPRERLGATGNLLPVRARGDDQVPTSFDMGSRAGTGRQAARGARHFRH